MWFWQMDADRFSQRSQRKTHSQSGLGQRSPPITLGARFHQLCWGHSVPTLLGTQRYVPTVQVVPLAPQRKIQGQSDAAYRGPPITLGARSRYVPTVQVVPLAHAAKSWRPQRETKPHTYPHPPSHSPANYIGGQVALRPYGPSRAFGDS